jgi:hypothetical protein
MSEAWRPLLVGDEADRAAAVAAEIGAELRPGEPADRERRHTLATGTPGHVLLHHYLARSTEGDGHEAAEERLRGECVQLLAGVRMDASLYHGFCGLLWVMAHTDERWSRPAARSPSAKIDTALRAHLATSPWRGPYDLVSGLTGLGVYALERLPDPLAADCLEQVVNRLEELAERSEAGVTWWTPAGLLPSDQRAQAPHGYANLGVAHGVPGAIAVLAGAAAAGVAVERSRALATRAVSWLLEQRLPEEGTVRFAYWLTPAETPRPARSAWCYGDPGIAAALLSAARCLGEPAWEHEALELAVHAARRPVEESGVTDAGLCHGAAGLGHIFNRLYQSTGEAELASAARFWLGRALELRRPGHGVAGFVADTAGEDPRQWERGFLMGAAGIALALVAAVSEAEPAWDRLMLLSPPCGPVAGA